MAERMSLDKLNELFAEALRRHVARGGLIGKPDDPATRAAHEWWWKQTEEIREKERRRAEDEWLSTHVNVTDVLNDGLTVRTTGLPSGWGVQSMKQALRYGGRVARPTQGNPQPTYSAMCVGCGRPITKDKGSWRDHAGSHSCPDDMCLVDHDQMSHHVAPLHRYHRDKNPTEPGDEWDEEDDDDW